MEVKVNDGYTYLIEINQDKILVDQQAVDINYISRNSKHFHFIYKNSSYSTEVISLNKLEKTVSVKVNGTVYVVSVQDQYDMLLKQMGLDASLVTKVQEIKAPMPGLVLNVFVEPGMAVAKGDNLLTLEAMKMENMIKSPTDGVVKNVLIVTGDKVDKNQILIRFD